MAGGTGCRSSKEGFAVNMLTENMLRQIRAVIFDLDGTLVDSMWIWKKIDIEYLGRFQIPLPEDLQKEIEGMSFTETAHYFKKRFSLPQDIETIKADWNQMAWDKYSREVPLKPGVEAFIQECQGFGIRFGIATSNSRELVENVVAVHHLEHVFSCIITGCDVGRGKPAPDIYLRAAEQLGVEPEHCLVFEDIIPGILAGKAAGMQVCAVEDAYSGAVREEKIKLADYYIRDYWELV